MIRSGLALAGAAVTLAGFLVSGCGGESGTGIPAGNLDDLELRFVSGFIAADLMPVVPPDPVICRLTLVAHNTSTSEPLGGVTIPQADVVRITTGERMGSVALASSWDGVLGPGETDTVMLSKIASPVSPFTPPCREYVRLLLAVRHQPETARTFTVDSLFFTCTY